MGLIYSSSDASSVINTLTTNLSIANAIVAQLNTGSQRLVAAVDGHTLSGAAYNAGKGLFSELIIPSIKRVSTAITNVQNDLTKFSAANSFISDEGYLDEDNLREQLTTLQSSKASLENSAHVAGTLANIPIPAIADMLREQQRDFLKRAESYQKDIDRVKKKIKKLTEFDGKTKGLFQSSLDDFKLAMQGVVVLNGTTVNSNGSYSLPKGTDKSYFNKVQTSSDAKAALKQLTEYVDPAYSIAEGTLGGLKVYAQKQKVKAIRLGSRAVTNYSFSRIARHARALESVSDDLLDHIDIVSNSKTWKGLGALGMVAGVAFDYDDQMKKYNNVGRAIQNTVAHTTIQAAGAQIGAAIGTAIPIPIVGTIAGAVIGMGIGYLGSELYDWVETGKAEKKVREISNKVNKKLDNLKDDIGSTFAFFGKTLGGVFG